MYLQHFGLEHSPFTRQPSPDVFFAQVGRKNILKDLRHDLQQGNAAMVLTGPKGSGKTLFCRLIQHRLDGSSRKVVYLKNPVGSFDELVRKICLKLGMPSSMDTEQNKATNLHALLRDQQEKGCRVLLLIDESEKMFLATLERLFRLLHELNVEYGVQAMLAGQSALNTSIEQLSGFCEDVRIASSYELATFSAEETSAYLAYRLRGAGDGRGAGDPIFSGKAAQKIFRLGQGIPGVMDGIAETALENAAAAGANSVLPVHVKMPDDPVAVPLAVDDEESGGGRKGLLFLLLLSLLAFFFFGQPSFFSNQKDAPQEIVQEPENAEILLALPEEEGRPLPFVEKDGGQDKSSGESSFFSLPVPQRPDFKKEKNDDVASEVIRINEISEKRGIELKKVIEYGEQQFEKIDKEVIAEIVAEAVGEKPVETTSVLSSEELKQAVDAAQAAQAVQAATVSEPGTETLATAKKLPVIKSTSIIEITPGMKKTRPPAAEEPALESEQKRKKATIAPPKPKTLLPVASARGVVVSTVSGQQQVQTQAQAQPQTSVAVPARKPKKIQAPKITVTPVAPQSSSARADQLFARYLGVGSRWAQERYGNKFTVQLLILSADDAVADIKKMIVRDEYQEHGRKLYILRRDTLPPTLFVCYGVYSSMDEARSARNAMPLFLRKHHPYALSISDVLAKARD